MKALLIILLALSAPIAQPAPPALTGKRRAEIAQNRVTQKVERKRTGKKGSTNEWETARSFPLMFAPVSKDLNTKPKKETRP